MEFVVLRLIHIVGGAFWFGAAVTMFLFLQPTARAVGPDGQRFMLHLLRDRRLSEVVLVAALLTGIAGAILFWLDTNGLQVRVMMQPHMLGFTVGGIAGGIALLLFLLVGYPAARRLMAIGHRLEIEGRPPNEDEQRIVATSQGLLSRIGLIVLVLLGVAVATMATGQYWPLVI